MAGPEKEMTYDLSVFTQIALCEEVSNKIKYKIM